MSDHAALRDEIWKAFQAEPKPVTHQRALEIARKVLSPKAPELIPQFTEWFAKHGTRALEKLHG